MENDKMSEINLEPTDKKVANYKQKNLNFDGKECTVHAKPSEDGLSSSTILIESMLNDYDVKIQMDNNMFIILDEDKVLAPFPFEFNDQVFEFKKRTKVKNWFDKKFQDKSMVDSIEIAISTYLSNNADLVTLVIEDNNTSMSFNDYPEYIRRDSMALINDGSLFDSLQSTVSYLHAGDKNEMKALILAFASVLTDNPVHIILGGETGKGKTNLVNAIKDNFPADHVFHFRNFSPKFMFYDKDNFNDDYNILIVDDVDLSKQENIEVLKELTDNNKPVKELKTVKDQEPITLTLPGKYLVILTYAKSNPDEELANRFFNIGLIRSKNDDNMVIEKIKNNVLVNAKNSESIQRLQLTHQAAFTYLAEQNINVFNPYINRIDMGFVNNRDVGNFITLVDSFTLYNQVNRNKLKIGDNELTLGSSSDVDEVLGMWKIKTQKKKLNTRQERILKLSLREMTREEAMDHRKEVLKDYNNPNLSEAYRDTLIDKEWTRQKIASKLDTNSTTLKFDLDTPQKDRNTKNLFELGLINRYKFDPNQYNSPWVYYFEKSPDGSNSESDWTYDRIINMYQSNNGPEVKCKLIWSLLYKYKYLVTNDTKKYIDSYVAASDHDLNTDESTYSFLNGFLTDHLSKFSTFSTDTPLSVIKETEELRKTFFSNLGSNNNASCSNHPEPSQNEESESNMENAPDLDDSLMDFWMNIKDIIPDGSIKTFAEIEEEYPHDPNNWDEHLVMKMEVNLNDLCKKGLLKECFYDNKFGYKKL